jgi:hypothetical protein
MNEFALIFRNTADALKQLSPEQMQDVMKQWQDWMGSIAAQNKLASPGNRLGSEGKIVKPNNVVTDGPYAEIKEMISGFIAVKADSLSEATTFAKGCPILKVGGNVEVRNVIPMDM